MLRIRADMNALTEDRRKVQLGGMLPDDLQPGLHVLLYEPGDFEVEAVIEFVQTDYGANIWYGILDWETWRDI